MTIINTRTQPVHINGEPVGDCTAVPELFNPKHSHAHHFSQTTKEGARDQPVRDVSTDAAVRRLTAMGVELHKGDARR